MANSDWWNEVMGPVALHLSDNPALAVSLVTSGMNDADVKNAAYQLNLIGGDGDYPDEGVSGLIVE